MIIATFLRDLDDDWRSDARLYRLSEPVSYGSKGGTTEYVVVSAVVAPFSGPETNIFPTDADGIVLVWIGLPGSFQGGMDHRRALESAGWEVRP